ncbi:hypothetical protein JCM10212_002791 [Sporobolomyces blumeae]
MAAQTPPPRSRILARGSAASTNPERLASPSPSRPSSALSRTRGQPGATASPQVKAALAALRSSRNRPSAPDSPSSVNPSASSTSAPSADPFSTPVRDRTSNASDASSSATVEGSRPGSRIRGEMQVEWGTKSQHRLIETAKRTGLLNLSSQSLASIPTEVYSALIPRTNHYHPSQRNRSSYKEERVDFSMTRSEDDLAWYEQRDLRSLNVANNEIEALEESIAGFEELEFLDVHGNSLKSIPSSLGFLTNLTSLSLASNSLTTFPVELTNLRNLVLLDLSSNALRSLWPVDWRDRLPEVLVPPEKSPSATPESPERVVDVVGVSNTDRPDGGSRSTAAPFPLLQTLSLSGNIFDHGILSKEGFDFPPRLKTLELSKCELTDSDVPPSLFVRLSELVELDLSDNALSCDVFSPALFFVERPASGTRDLRALRRLDLSLNPIDHLGHLEDFLTDHVSRPIEYVGLDKSILNLVESETARLRGGRPIGLPMSDRAREEDVGNEVKDERLGLEVRVRECSLENEHERRRDKFPDWEGKAKTTHGAPSRSIRTSAPLESLDASPTTSSASDGQPTSTSTSTPVKKKQVLLEPWEIEAAAGLATPAGRRKAAAQAAREREAEQRREEEAARVRREEREREVKMRKEREAEERAAKEREERRREEEDQEEKLRRDMEALDVRGRDLPEDTSSATRGEADPNDPAYQLVRSAYDGTIRTVNLSRRSLASMPTLANGGSRVSQPGPVSSLDLSHNVLRSCPMSSLATWGWTHSLRTLNLCRNRISDWGSSTTEVVLPNVVELDLSHNALSSTSSTSSRPVLLDISTAFPALQTLSLAFNRLTDVEGVDSLILPLPSSTRSVAPALRVLNLSGNKISNVTGLCQVGETFDERIQGKPKGETGGWTLEQLDLSDNEIARLPPVLGLLPHSLIVSVSGNTFRIPRRDVWENPGARTLLPELRERLGR